ncbi:hypothetical protein DRJ04_05405 [Candidatus Aerophobetes bacterium]|uniref:MobA-like NTP transferase domain-containing protein n=1 Tax=Aerophobetes bacterium TaxID=2030807 RepID=A0A662DEV9_UNCAE|nr:MAG: hypothetical protein DRJ04_05405 [Candidatus Aerophobetes bacterium]
MKALIIATGKSNKPKDELFFLTQLLGLPLIERVIRTAKQTGVDEFVVVVDYSDKKKLKLDERKIGAKITYVDIENRECERGDGIFVLRAKEFLNEKFVVLRADLVFDYRILKGLINLNIKSAVVLAVERKKLSPEGVIQRITISLKNHQRPAVVFL